MARRQSHEVNERTTWHKSEKGCWSLSLGERGCRVRLMQRKPGGTFFRVTWIAGQGKSQKSLQTSSRSEARRRAERFLRALSRCDDSTPAAPLTLEGLWNRYQQEAPRYRRNAESTKKGKRQGVQNLFAVFGRNKLTEHLCLNDVEIYVERREQGLNLEDGRRLKPVRARAVQSDLQLLRTMLNWATTVKVDGQWLLKENPLRGMELLSEKNPRRPVTTYERFQQTLEAAKALVANARQRRGRQKWLRLMLALTIAEATGRRLGSIRGLCWADFDFAGMTIWWNPEFDKGRREDSVHLPQALAEQVKALRVQLEAFGDGWLFPKKAGDAPWPRTMFDEALREAEKQAGLPKLRGSLWHAFRRKWATERKPLPDADVMRAGGWKDKRTFETCYQQADAETTVMVMECPNKLMSRKISAVG